MSRLGYRCKFCGCFRENISDTLTRHILAAKDSLCTEGQDPFEGGLCSHFATFEEVKKTRGRYLGAKRHEIRDAVNY
jgi:hypothetical protein